jgi:carboxypeptidase T
VSDNVAIDEDEPVVLYDGVHHAEEVLGLESIMWMLEDLTTRYGVDDTVTSWVDGCEIWFIPMLNPDGHEIVASGADTTWRKDTRDNDGDGEFDPVGDGVDLNANYDFQWEDGGSGNPESETYRGPEPFSENESRIIRDLCLATKPVFALNYHSPRSSDGDLVYYPWYWVGNGFAPDHYVIYDVASNLCARTLNEQGEPFTPYYGFATQGKARNWQYGVAGTIGYTMEILSYLCQPSGDRVDDICERVARGSYYLLERTSGPGITGHVTDASTGDPVVAEVDVVELASDLVAPRTTDPVYGRYWRMLVPGTYTVTFRAPGYDTRTFSDVVVDSAGLAVVDCALEAWAGVPEGSTGARIERVAPNPSFGGASVAFVAAPGTTATVEIYTAGGRRVARTESSAGADGHGLVTWDGRDAGGRFVSSGVYFARLACGDALDEAKIVIVR